MDCNFLISSWGFLINFLSDFHMGYLQDNQKQESSFLWSNFCRFCCVGWSKIIQLEEFFVLKLVLNLWDKKMIWNILIDCSINRSFQEVDLSNTGGRHETPNNYRLKKLHFFFRAFGIKSLIWPSRDAWATNTKGNTESWFITEDDQVPLINRSILIISSPYWTLSFLFKSYKVTSKSVCCCHIQMDGISEVLWIKKQLHQYHFGFGEFQSIDWK